MASTKLQFFWFEGRSLKGDSCDTSSSFFVGKEYEEFMGLDMVFSMRR